MKVLFLTLDTYSRTGGIQQFNRCFALALHQWAASSGHSAAHWSLWDEQQHLDSRYEPGSSFRGFSRNRFAFIKAIWQHSNQYDLIIAGHINLAPLALLFAGRRARWEMIAHGVEVWTGLSWLKQRALKRMHRIWGVSHYTLGVLQQQYALPDEQLLHFPNCLDPFMVEAPVLPEQHWNRHWRIDTTRPCLLTLARLSGTEKAKGYDRVLALLPRLIDLHPTLGYVLAGRHDAEEYHRIQELITQLGLQGRVVVPGFVAAENLPALYHFAKVFVMPSAKEGFGIVYLEAAWWGCAVVAEDAGGVAEALHHGEWGTLVPAGNNDALLQAISDAMAEAPVADEHLAKRRQSIIAHFGFGVFCSRLHGMLLNTG